MINHGDGKMKPVNDACCFICVAVSPAAPVAKPVPIPAKAVVPVFQ